MFKRNRVLFILAAMGVMLFSAMVYADDITDSINEALQYYKEGKYSDAMGSLNYASQLIGQKKGGDLQAFLPKPLQGWTAEEPSSQAAGSQMFGGGVTAERTYTKDIGSVTVGIVTDSPVLQGMMMMFTNPMMATVDGGKLEKIGGEKAIVKYNSGDKSGNINIVIASRFLVTVEGSSVSLEDLKAYAGAVDYKKLATLQ
jgi:polyhydroxyalkanoate synthesis regulator protein